MSGLSRAILTACLVPFGTAAEAAFPGLFTGLLLPTGARAWNRWRRGCALPPPDTHQAVELRVGWGVERRGGAGGDARAVLPALEAHGAVRRWIVDEPEWPRRARTRSALTPVLTLLANSAGVLLRQRNSCTEGSMSLRPMSIDPIPEETVRVARAAFPKGNLFIRMRDELGVIFTDQSFSELYPSRGQPALAPWRLALVTLMQFVENLSSRQAANSVRSRIDWKYVLGSVLTDPGSTSRR